MPVFAIENIRADELFRLLRGEVLYGSVTPALINPHTQSLVIHFTHDVFANVMEGYAVSEGLNLIAKRCFDDKVTCALLVGNDDIAVIDKTREIPTYFQNNDSLSNTERPLFEQVKLLVGGLFEQHNLNPTRFNFDSLLSNNAFLTACERHDRVRVNT